MKPAASASDNLPEVKLQTVEGTTVTPYDQVNGYFIHDKSRVPFILGQVDPQVIAAASRYRKGGRYPAGMASERIVSPVENEVVHKQHDDTKSAGSTVDTDTSPAKQQDTQNRAVMHDSPNRTESGDRIGLQSREWPEDSSRDGNIDLSLPTEFVPIPMTEITEDFSIPINQMDHTRIEVSNHRRKTSEGESLDTGNGNNAVDNSEKEHCVQTSPEKDGASDGEKSSTVPEQSKDERILTGVTKENAGNMAITDVFFMVGWIIIIVALKPFAI